MTRILALSVAALLTVSGLALAQDIAATLFHPFPNPHVIRHCAGLAAFLVTAYVVLRTWRGEEPTDR